MMGDKVVRFPGLTTVDLPVNETLDLAKRWDMTKCIIIGLDEEENIRFGGTTSDAFLINYLLCWAQWFLMSQGGDA